MLLSREIGSSLFAGLNDDRRVLMHDTVGLQVGGL